MLFVEALESALDDELYNGPCLALGGRLLSENSFFFCQQGLRDVLCTHTCWPHGRYLQGILNCVEVS
jgi:hypothetical protein